MTAADTKMLARADAARADPSSASPYQLWQLADREAAGVKTARTSLYRHAMIHAGYLVKQKRPYRVCPICEQRL